MVHKKRAKLHAAKRNRNKKLNDRFRTHKPAAESRVKQIIGVLTSEHQHNLSSELKAAELNSIGKLTLTNTNIGASLRVRCGY